MDDAPTIGIDLGTTYSCVAVCEQGRVKIIPNDQNTNTMASIVSFCDSGRVIGDDAKENSITNPANTIFGVKRIIGCRYEDKELQNHMKTVPYEIINDNGNPKIKVIVKGEDEIFAPEQISAMVLQKLKENADAHFGKAVSKAVITVPANFRDSQRQATKDAGRIAGLEVLRIINEPTAAALAYGIQDKYHNDNTEKNILVYDFGGGTFDISVISIENGIFDVKATNGDTHLGGDDIDLCLLNHFVEEFKEKHLEDLSADPRAIRRLRMQCERLKRTLSTSDKASLDIDHLYKGIDFYSGLTRDKFEELCGNIFERTLKFVADALNDADMTKDKIDDVLLVGGSSVIPKIRQLVQNFFDGKTLETSLNPDEAIAAGAAIQAAILDGDVSNKFAGELLLLDVTPLSLGVQTVGGVMNIIIPRNSQIPVKMTKKYSNEKDNQTAVKITVFEGERTMTELNSKLGEFMLTGITPVPRGKAEILVTFEVNSDGILYVTAEEKNGTTHNTLMIKMDKNRLTEEEIGRMIVTAEKYRSEDEKRKAIVQSKIALETYCFDTKRRAANPAVKEKEIITTICDKALSWIDDTEHATKEDYENKKKEVYDYCNPILRLYL